jgi:hypothetical protein
MDFSRAASTAPRPRRRQAALQYRTCSQSRAHFARHAIRRPHTAQVLSSSVLPAEPGSGFWRDRPTTLSPAASTWRTGNRRRRVR